ncbi:hypothetical protein BKA65DRAFT_556477 [Rhexocercosporidium sp. MPI-PUGE-AT-0058]|nr:hypothetical protein BKA65DRAFT_556477 [Rhexocercosporidium sp. MPI-PUGE-AT-0058]
MEPSRLRNGLRKLKATLSSRGTSSPQASSSQGHPVASTSQPIHIPTIPNEIHPIIPDYPQPPAQADPPFTEPVAASTVLPTASSSQALEKPLTPVSQPGVSLGVISVETAPSTGSTGTPFTRSSQCPEPTTSHVLPVASSALPAIASSSGPPGEPVNCIPLPDAAHVTITETPPANANHVQSTQEEMQASKPITVPNRLASPSSASTVDTNTLASLSKMPSSNQAFHDALEKMAKNLDSSAKEAFMKSYERLSPEKTLETILELDNLDAISGVRTSSKALGPAIGVLDTVMRSVSICIQQSPEISSLVVGGIRLVIDLVAKFVQFYNKLSQMICQMVDYLEIFDQYSNFSHETIVHEALVDIYGDLLAFCVESRRVFVDQQGTVKKFGHFRTFLRVQWQPFEEKFGEIKSSFAHHLDVLMNSAQALQLGTLNEQFAAIRSGFNASETERIRIKSNEQIAERRQFLEWVSDINYEETFNDIIKKKHPGTGEWLLHHEKFRCWAKSPKPSLLWCHGKPGAGKSVLSSLVLDHVSAFELNDPETCVIFAYYSYQTPERHSLAKLLGSFIRQLASKLKEVPPDTLKFFQSHYRDAKTPNADDLNRHFFECVHQFPSQIIVVCDGLDECETNSREEVFDFIARLVSKQSTLAKVFITSRRDEDIKDAFQGCPVVEIDSQLVNEDIQVFLRDEIERRIENKSLKLRKQDLKITILEALSSKANGMFLWAKLQLDWVCKQRGDSDILGELESLPPDLYGTYDLILQRIEQRPPKQQELARKALMWVLYAKRPLHSEELVHALAIREGITQIEELKDSTYDCETILSCCGGLLRVLVTERYFLNSPDHIHPVHYSLFEYFTSTTPKRKQDLRAKYFTTASQAHSEITSSCIDYLHLNVFSDGPCPAGRHLWLRTHEFLLACYSSFYFDNHLEQVNSMPLELLQKVNALLDWDPKRLAAILQCRRCHGDSDTAHLNFSLFTFSVDATTLMISTTLYDRPEFKHLHSEWTKESLPKYSLHQALSGSESAVARLLDSGLVDVNEKNDDGLTPLLYASQSGFHSVARRLVVDGKADLTIEKEWSNETALSVACKYGHTSIVRMLIENGAVMQDLDVIYACEYTCKDDTVLALLLANGAVATSNALEQATINCFTNRCRLLLDHGALVSVRNLSLAFHFGGRYKAILKLLGGHSTPEIILEAEVLWASGIGCKNNSLLEKLLANGAIATSEALEQAALQGYESRCVLLLDHGALVTALALSNACQQFGWDSDIVELLNKHSTPEVLAEAEDVDRRIRGKAPRGDSDSSQ